MSETVTNLFVHGTLIPGESNYAYILRCTDGRLYYGSTTESRVKGRCVVDVDQGSVVDEIAGVVVSGGRCGLTI